MATKRDPESRRGTNKGTGSRTRSAAVGPMLATEDATKSSAARVRKQRKPRAVPVLTVEQTKRTKRSPRAFQGGTSDWKTRVTIDGKVIMPSKVTEVLSLKPKATVYFYEEEGRMFFTTKKLPLPSETISDHVDKALEPFLTKLANKIKNNPDDVRPVTKDFRTRMLEIAGL